MVRIYKITMVSMQKQLASQKETPGVYQLMIHALALVQAP